MPPAWCDRSNPNNESSGSYSDFRSVQYARTRRITEASSCTVRHDKKKQKKKGNKKRFRDYRPIGHSVLISFPINTQSELLATTTASRCSLSPFFFIINCAYYNLIKIF
ncbi:hypothetical protein PUN28_017282 [Cardiocondyla obscurior]|uniref:Uncharacterized protein n=1 Tax=Cardiocondyla obscurior TaxID=286306 RepID=A0AAW2ENE4_9HYME